MSKSTSQTHDIDSGQIAKDAFVRQAWVTPVRKTLPTQHTNGTYVTQTDAEMGGFGGSGCYAPTS